MKRVRPNLGRWMGEFHLSDTDLADMCDIPYSAAQKWSKNFVDFANLEYASRIMTALKLKIDELFLVIEDEEEEEMSPEERAKYVQELRDRKYDERVNGGKTNVKPNSRNPK